MFFKTQESLCDSSFASLYFVYLRPFLEYDVQREIRLLSSRCYMLDYLIKFASVLDIRLFSLKYASVSII